MKKSVELKFLFFLRVTIMVRLIKFYEEDLVNIVVNGKNYEVSQGKKLLTALEELGIQVPNFCYDSRIIEKDESCGICVVEVNGCKKKACEIELEDNMVVRTHTDEVVDERKAILKEIISEHPLDCLGCTKSGECKLQEYCYEYNVEQTSNACGENLALDSSNPFFTIDSNKCISCGKCVKICETLQCNEILKLDPLTKKVVVSGSGVIDETKCAFCGNCVSVCPVGALQAKEKTISRKWETKRTQTTCSYCGVGCQFDLLSKGNKIVGVEPVNIAPNDGLLCVKGKFGYKFIDHPERLKTPLIKENGEFREASWEEAYDLFLSKANKIKGEFGPDAFAGLASARCTNEDNFVFQKFMRVAIGTNNIDHCARL